MPQLDQFESGTLVKDRFGYVGRVREIFGKSVAYILNDTGAMLVNHFADLEILEENDDNDQQHTGG